MNTLFGILPADFLCFSLEVPGAAVQTFLNDLLTPLNAFLALFGITLPSLSNPIGLILSCPVRYLVN